MKAFLDKKTNEKYLLITNNWYLDTWYLVSGLHLEFASNPYIIDNECDLIEIPFSEFEDIVEKEVDAETNYYLKAKELAKKAHEGQVDKGGKDYFSSHLVPVSKLASKRNILFGSIVGLLHDTLEDTSTSEEDLRKEFPDIIVDAVVSLTKKRKESYEKYILRVKENPIAREVKICDLENNMDLSRLNSIEEKDIQRLIKYSKALSILLK